MIKNSGSGHVDRGALTIRARRTHRGGPTDGWIASERASGTFERQLILDGCVDAEQMRVGYHDGVLTVSIPVTEKLAPVARSLVVPFPVLAAPTVWDTGRRWLRAGRRSLGALRSIPSPPGL